MEAPAPPDPVLARLEALTQEVRDLRLMLLMLLDRAATEEWEMSELRGAALDTQAAREKKTTTELIREDLRHGGSTRALSGILNRYYDQAKAYGLSDVALLFRAEEDERPLQKKRPRPKSKQKKPPKPERVLASHPSELDVHKERRRQRSLGHLVHRRNEDRWVA